VVLVVFSLLFYASFNSSHLVFLVVPLVIDFILSKHIYSSKNEYLRKYLLIISITSSILLLGYFKYILWFAETTQFIFSNPTIFSTFVTQVVAPVGISFLTFQRISYIVDVYQKKIKPAQSLLDYFVYAAFFPQLIAGPIVRFHEVSQELEQRSMGYQEFFACLQYLAVGLALKVFIADRIFILEDQLVTQLQDLNILLALILIFSFSFRIYFDFLAYTLIAIGIGRLVGFHFPDNFNSPYRAKSVQDFWRRWNITLSTWIRDYIYIPLGGSKKGSGRTYLNLMITMLLAGLWHGAGWTFIIWGALHGSALSLERIWKNKFEWRPSLFVSQLLTFLFITFSWVPFMFPTIEKIREFYEALAVLEFGWLTIKMENLFYSTVPAFLLGLVWIVYCSESKLRYSSPMVWKTISIIGILLFSLGYSLIRKSVPFIYYQF